MRGSAAVFIIGMFAAAVVGIAASFAMQSVALENGGPGEVPDNTGEVAGAVKNELSSLEHAMQQQIGELTDSVDTLNGEVLSLKKILQELNVRLSSAGSAAPVVAAGGETQVASTNLGEAINRVLDDRDKRREEERTQEREQRVTDMRERFKSMMTSRTERYAEEKGWDSAKTEQVKQIIGDYYEKMSELGGMMFGRRRGGGRGGSEESREQMSQLREETKAKLLEVVTEAEAAELLQGGMDHGGSRRRPSGDRRPGGDGGSDRGGR